MASLVLPFESPEVSLEVAGGKGTNLSRLVRAGFPMARYQGVRQTGQPHLPYSGLGGIRRRAVRRSGTGSRPGRPAFGLAGRGW